MAASKDSLESRLLRIDIPGLGVGCLMLDCSFERTSGKVLGMNRTIRVMVWVSSWVVAIVGEFAALVKYAETDV